MFLFPLFAFNMTEMQQFNVVYVVIFHCFEASECQNGDFINQLTH